MVYSFAILYLYLFDDDWDLGHDHAGVRVMFVVFQQLREALHMNWVKQARTGLGFSCLAGCAEELT